MTVDGQLHHDVCEIALRVQRIEKSMVSVRVDDRNSR